MLAAARDGLARLAALLRHTPRQAPTPAACALFWGGLLVLMAASCALESTRLYRWEGLLPGPAGGALGAALGPWSVRMFGFAGSAVAWIALLVLALPAVLRFSWVRLADRIGAALDDLRLGWVRRRATREDERIGAALLREREQSPGAGPAPWDDPLAEGAAEVRAVDTPPWPRQARASPPAPVAIQPTMLEVPPSERVARERQKPLFDDIADQRLPQVDLLDAVGGRQESVSPESLEMTSRLIEKKLADFGVVVQVVAASPGPVITRYEIEPDTGVKGSQIVNLAKDLARSLGLVSIRVVETVPGRTTMALELPNARRQSIRLSEILGSQPYHAASSMLTLGLGKDIVGAPVVADLARMPHCLVAGTTGSGKSVGINGMILSLLYKAEARDVRLILIDPKMLEMSVYEGIPHLLCPVVTDMKQAANALNWCVGEMERRYKLMSRMGVRQLSGYNRKIDEATQAGELIPNPFSLTPEAPEPLQRLPFIVVVIDELADLMMVVGKKIEELIARLAQKARAAGIHLVLATQRPSVDVITGLIKANIPTRLSFQVNSKIDSRTILDQQGAEALLGQGDMLYLAPGTGVPVRVHGAFVSDEEVHRVVEYLKSQGEPNYIEGILEGGTLDGEGDDAAAGEGGAGAGGENDPMYDQAVAVVLQHRRASISLVQRHLRIGYNRAARLLEQMEQSGVVSSMATNGNRDILVPPRAE
jgi:S-DNA-T family DNA segregation ATPase FtsK/SpoIIIE